MGCHFPHHELQLRFLGAVSGYVVRPRWRLRSRSLLGKPQQRVRLSTKAPALENEKAGRELTECAAWVMRERLSLKETEYVQNNIDYWR